MMGKDIFSLRTVRKKIIMVSKLAGFVLIISYIASDHLPVASDVSFLIWLVLVSLLVLAIDYLMGRFISTPVSKLNQSARKMAQLDFSVPCAVKTNDEFGELSENLNKMSGNLQQALTDLKDANIRLEKDVEKERLHPERFDCVEFLETVAGRLLIDIPDSNFELQYELPEHKVFIFTDKSRMEQVLGNLIVNAKKNVQPGGIMRLSLTEKDGMLHFSIFNQGLPVLEENLSKIWMKFYRDKNSQYRGSGLGLAIVAQILSMQGLDYGVENMPGGVSFYFSVPICE